MNRRLLLEVLALLPEQQRRIVALRYLSEQSTHETAQLAAVSTGTVKSALSRALLKLRKELHHRGVHGSNAGSCVFNNKQQVVPNNGRGPVSDVSETGPDLRLSPVGTTGFEPATP
ncbi:RNA polymerase sigma factor [Streptomyces sp. NPDC005808]|uniref:RNA polymerase sigma factor n=1 Tax=Streptomyces sp. NPDC005808 TaxID=3364734 RepID=UPI003692123D